jgi:hypothetical protein
MHQLRGIPACQAGIYLVACFADDLSTVSFAEGGTLRFQPEALIEHHNNLLFVRSDYFHWFGTYTGTLPGGIELREAYGVRERHDALW